jgi:hypothetical protein
MRILTFNHKPDTPSSDAVAQALYWDKSDSCINLITNLQCWLPISTRLDNFIARITKPIFNSKHYNNARTRTHIITWTNLVNQ